MRWEDFRRSDNIEDVRGDGGGYGGGGGFSIPGGGGGLGIGTIIVLGLIGWFLGIDPRILIGGAEIFPAGPESADAATGAAGQEGRADRRSRATSSPRSSARPKTCGATSSAPTARPIARHGCGCIPAQTSGGACGMAQSAMGPFYCPPDKRIFLDTAFFREMEQKFRACKGKQCEFAQAYVIAHEVGHHVQNLLGILPRATQMQQAAGSKAQANNIQVRVELQADCFGGVWANHAQRKKDFIDPGDIEGAIGIASAIGDDRMQRQTHGTRGAGFLHAWLVGAARALVQDADCESGRVADCDTFRTAQL